MTFPFGYRPHQSDFFATDFSEYTVGVAPPDWTEAIGASEITPTIQSVAILSGKVMRLTRAAQTRTLMTWNPVPQVSDIEQLTLHRVLEAMDEGSDQGGFAVRVDPVVTNLTAYAMRVHYFDGTSHGSIVGKYIAGNFTQWNATGGDNAGGPKWYWIRMRVVGQLIQRKYWLTTSPEPAWIDYTADGSVVGPGAAGIFQASFNDTEVAYYAASVGSPSNPPLSIPLPTLP